MTTTHDRSNPDGGDAERDAPLTAEEWARMDAWAARHDPGYVTVGGRLHRVVDGCRIAAVGEAVLSVKIPRPMQ